MARHLFLTGEKRVGKSTLVRLLLREAVGPLGGFFTVRTEEAFPGQPSVHLLQAGREDTPGEHNRLFFCGTTEDREMVERFDCLGPVALTCPSAHLLVMDELGPHEEQAVAFCTAVLNALDSDIPVLGVLQRSDSPFLRKVADHPQARLLRITEENRDTFALKVKTAGPQAMAVLIEQGI